MTDLLPRSWRQTLEGLKHLSIYISNLGRHWDARFLQGLIVTYTFEMVDKVLG